MSRSTSASSSLALPRKSLGALIRWIMRWQVGVLKGDRKAVAQIFLSAVALVAVVVLCVLTMRPIPETSVLHPLVPVQAPLNVQNGSYSTIATMNGSVVTTERTFPQYGAFSLPGRLFRLENKETLGQTSNKDGGSVLVLVVLKDAQSWGDGRDAGDFFDLLDSFDYPKGKMSVTVLTSSTSEFSSVQTHLRRQIRRYSRLSVLFRDDFSTREVVTRENRHENGLQVNRRRVIARYRNFAVLSTMKDWHQHVLWVDADVHKIPAGLLSKMIQSGLDVVEPMCVRMKENGKDWYEYDLNAWVGRRKVRGSIRDTNFVPGDLSVKRMKQFHGKQETFVPLDSVGGTMLYAKAEVHRQGVLFPVHHVIGSEWGSEGYDGIETEGLCYVAHFLGFRCWGMPNDLIYHS
ncbi:hypothetical protein PHYPSEUDO_003458 [Phytophthora pseudosyringae]|uniref:Uncharacterized protein n=1 Tax=Phytophthora pseudosyringae TaxID=221518 RepID=A0A8T1VVT5_9STRA|nr:hypothetical protein PHYPSEUDO_003458 [Phytophthora pseudosyringae]